MPDQSDDWSFRTCRTDTRHSARRLNHPDTDTAIAIIMLSARSVISGRTGRHPTGYSVILRSPVIVNHTPPSWAGLARLTASGRAKHIASRGGGRLVIHAVLLADSLSQTHSPFGSRRQKHDPRACLDVIFSNIQHSTRLVQVFPCVGAQAVCNFKCKYVSM